jgi:hypothetical protein
MPRATVLICVVATGTGCTPRCDSPVWVSPQFTVDQRLDGRLGADPDSYGTQLCVSPSGAVFVVWLEDSDEHNSGPADLWMERSYARGEPGSWLGAAVRVRQGDRREAVNAAALHCDDEGAYVAWEEADPESGQHQIYFNRTLDGAASFLPADVQLDLDPEAQTMSLDPVLTSVAGVLYAGWVDDVVGHPTVLVAGSADRGASWSEPIPADGESGRALSGDWALAPLQGAVGVVWEAPALVGSDLWFGRVEVGGTGPAVQLDGGANEGPLDAESPRMCADGADVHVVWSDPRPAPAGPGVFLNSSSDGGRTWLTAAVRLDDAPTGAPVGRGGHDRFPRCAADEKDLHVVWEQDGTGIAYRAARAGRPEGQVRTLNVGSEDSPASGAALNPQIAGDSGAGTLAVVWVDGRNYDPPVAPHSDLFYTFADPTQTLAEAPRDYRLDSMYDAGSYKIDVAAGLASDSVLAAWIDGRNGSGDVYFTRLELGTESEPPPYAFDGCR